VWVCGRYEKSGEANEKENETEERSHCMRTLVEKRVEGGRLTLTNPGQKSSGTSGEKSAAGEDERKGKVH